MANVTFFVMVPVRQSEGEVIAEAGVQCPSKHSAIAQARGAVARGAIGAVAFMRSGDPALGEYGEATLICKEGDLPDGFEDSLAA